MGSPAVYSGEQSLNAGKAKLNRNIPRKGIWTASYSNEIYFHSKVRKEQIENDLIL
ncbi:MAG: hypothetical protein N4Q32_00005 [Neisseriaceae bacterium]|nr:hypothetical protein [Neisseriaceae bacterium]